MAGPRQLAAPPTWTPRPYGLLSVVQMREPGTPPEHWRNGVTWQDLCGMGSLTYDPFCMVTGSGNDPAAKASNVTQSTYGATPFTVFGEFDCSPVGYSPEERRARAADALTRTEAFQVEQAFWTGTAGGDTGQVLPHLAANTAVVETTLPVVQMQCAVTTVTGSVVLDIVEGMQRLEAAFANCSATNGQGVIHAPLILGEAMAAWGLVKAQGEQLKTAAGNLVALGAGYPGTSPAGVALANVAWIYMTGPVFAYRSESFTYKESEMFDRSENTLKSIVERTYLLGFSCCCLPGVAINVGGDVTGQPLSAF